LTRNDVLAALHRLGRRTKVHADTGQIAVLRQVDGRDAPVFVTVRASGIELGWRSRGVVATLPGAIDDAALAAALDAVTAPAD
jgi:hypothetical protein